MICKKCGISEMECDCPQWSPEAQRVFAERASGHTDRLQHPLQRLPDFIHGAGSLHLRKADSGNSDTETDS
jgi:hypothetical protein